MMYILKNLNGLIRLKVPSFKEACNLYNIDYIEPVRPCANGDNYYKGLSHIFSFFSPNSTAILSYELMSIQPAGNLQVSGITLVGSSETERQLPVKTIQICNLNVITLLRYQSFGFRFAVRCNKGNNNLGVFRSQHSYFYPDLGRAPGLKRFSYHINGLASNLVRHYTSQATTLSSCRALHPYFVTGFTDAEGSFIIQIIKSPNYRLG